MKDKGGREDLRHEADTELFFDVALDLLCIAGFDGHFKKLSPRWGEVLGWSTEELKARPFIEFVHEEDVASTLAAAAALAEGSEVVGFDNRYLCKDGSYRWLSWNSYAVVDRQVIIGAVRDITERRTAEDMLGEQHQQFLAILESFPEILYVTDPKTNEVLFANRELKDSLGNDPTGKICYEELQGLDAPCEFCTNAILFETREPHVWEYHNLKMDRYYSITDQLITWPDGREVRFEHAVDITDRKSAEGELLRHQEHLEELVQARTRALEQSKEKLTRQAQEILELSTPVMQVWQGVIVAPLIGTLDSQRTMQFMDRLLRAVVDTRSEVVLVDITGVPIADTQTAQNLVETAASVKLLGGHVVLTGVSPAIAQTLVRLGVDLSDVTTRSSLSSGIDYALSALGLRVESRRG